MKFLLVVAGGATIVAVFWDAFETLILPRRVSRRFRLAAAFFRASWWVWTRIARVPRNPGRRENT